MLMREARLPLWRRVQSDGSYASCRDSRVLFGLGKSSQPVDLEVLWPDGRKERWPDLETGRYHRLWPGSGVSANSGEPGG